MCTTEQENTSKFIENAITQALTRPQDSTPTEANPPGKTRTFRSNQESNSLYDTNLTMP